MGGRGAFSLTHGGMKAGAGGAGSLYVSKQVETREDIRTLFIDELGFKELYGTNDVETAQLAALGIQLKKLESEYGVLGDNDVYLSVTNKPGVKGAAAVMEDGSMVMFINPSLHNDVSGFNSALRREQSSGFKTETDGRITSNFSYTARHEYGHLAQFSYTNKTGESASEIRRAVQSNVTRGSGSAPSQYGATNDYEYFAESFASMTGGSPNAHGRALRRWMNGNWR